MRREDCPPDRGRRTIVSSRAWQAEAYTFDIRPESDDGTIIVVTVDADFGTIVGTRTANLVARNAR